MKSVANYGNAAFKTALVKARQWCTAEERCIWDVIQKLKRLECSAPDINRIIEQLNQEGFLNEQRYANAYTSGKFRISKWGKIKITSGMRMKKIPERMITIALNNIDPEIYRDCLVTLLRKKQDEIRSETPAEMRQKIVRFALQKGYESELVFSILRTNEE